MKTLVSSLAIWIAMAGVAAAQDVRDSLIVSGQVDVPTASPGGTGGVEWLRTTAQGGLQFGVLSGSRGDAWWTYGRAGAFVRRGRAVVGGTIEVGGGAQTASRFQYRRFDGQLTLTLRPGRLFLESEGQVAQMATDTREVARLGIRSVLTPTVAAGASYYLVASNGDLFPAVSARVDVDRRLVSLLGGIVVAREQRAMTLLSQTVTLPLTSTEVFAGGSIGTWYRLQVVASVSQAGDANRLLASLKIPLRSRTVSR